MEPRPGLRLPSWKRTTVVSARRHREMLGGTLPILAACYEDQKCLCTAVQAVDQDRQLLCDLTGHACCADVQLHACAMPCLFLKDGTHLPHCVQIACLGLPHDVRQHKQCTRKGLDYSGTMCLLINAGQWCKVRRHNRAAHQRTRPPAADRK